MEFFNDKLKKRRHIRGILFFLFCFITYQTQAQFTERPFTVQDSFLVDAQRVMKIGASHEADSIIRAFESIWSGSQLDDSHKEMIYKISKNMLNNGYRTSPHFEDFYAIISFGLGNKKLGTDKLDQFLSVMDTASSEYKKYVTVGFLSMVRDFIEQDVVHTSRFNQLKVSNGTFAFGNVFDRSIALKPGEEDPAPVVVDTATSEWFGHLEEEKKEEEEEEDLGWGTFEEDEEEEDKDDGDSGGWGWEMIDETEEEEAVFLEDTTTTSKGFLEIETTPTDVMPPIVGPYIQFTEADFSISSVFDTFSIKQTSGKFMAKDKVFVGNGGRATWENVGISPDEAYGKFNDYSFNAKSPIITANDMDMHYQAKFDSTVKGQFSYQAKPKDRIMGHTYPRFISYNANVPVKDLVKDVVFTGGFAMKGKHIYSKSINTGASIMEVIKDEKVKLRAESTSPFVFSDSAVSNPRASLTIYQSNGVDSVYHPAVYLKYDAGQSRLAARKDKHGYKYAPFTDSYHKMELQGEYLTWDLNTDSVNLGIINAKNKVPLQASSMDYFQPAIFSRLKGLASFHPLQLVVGYRRIAKSNTFTVEDMAKQYRLNPNTVRGTMVGLEQRGFIGYDTKTDLVTVTRKAVLYSYANMRRMDYDNINIRALSPTGHNATFSLDSLDLTLSGVDGFLISDSLKVLVEPDNKSIVVKKNRDFQFTGRMTAGKFVYRGEDFQFGYDSFLVHMPYIEELAFVVKDSSSGADEELPNSMVGTGGTLYISEPNNKSGLKPHDKYPLFQASSGGSFYFGGDEILDGAYKGDTSIFFDVPPFAIDSLNSSDPSSINFAGTFHSGGIFPVFKENIRIMPDKSFGFDKFTPEEGYPIYENKLKEKATYYNKISLTNKGIRGDGRIEYLTGTFLSDDFVFYSDSVKTERGTGGAIEAGNYASTSYPSVKFEKYNMRWLVNKDSMLLTSQSGKPFEVYNKQYSFDGTLALSPKNLFGGGTFESPNSITRSYNFSFEETKFNSSNSLFLIRSDDPKKPSMRGVRVSVDYNIAEKYADISSEKSGDDVFTFPYAQYSTSLAKAHWDFNEEKVYLSATDTAKGYLSTFTSLNKEQNELEFEAKSAVYDQKEQTLNIDGVEGIRVANVIIIPEDGKVVVRENADMDVLNNSSVIINSFTKYHTLTEGHLKIRSRKRFDGDAIYTYVNDIQDSMFITFDHFDVKTISDDKNKKSDSPVEKFETSADAIVTEEDNLKIFAGLLYKGKVRLVDYKKYLEFDGVVSLDIDREENSWFAYKSDTEDSHGKIWIDEDTKQAGYPTKLASGLYLGNESNSVYGTMLEFKRSRMRDIPIFQAKGYLKYNNSSQDYVIAPTEKLDGTNPQGNQFTYNHGTQKITYDGTFSLIKDNKDFLLQASGKGIGNISDSTYSLNAMLLMGMEPTASAMEIMVEDFLDQDHEIPANPIFSELKNKIAQFLDPKTYQKFVQEAESSGGQSIANYFSNAIGLSDVSLKWSEQNKAFYSEGEIGFSHIFKENINTRVKGFVEIPKIEDQSIINIYLETHKGKWYYISHKKGNIYVYSSNNDFNDAIDDPKAKSKMKLTEPHEVALFLEDYSVKYLDGKGDFKGEEKIEDDPFKKKEEKKEEEKKDGF